MATEALKITATFFAMGLIDFAINGDLPRYLSGAGVIAMTGTFAVFYIAIYAWTRWYYRKR